MFHGLGVVLHLTGLGIDIDGAAVAIGDVRQMRELRADLGITDFGIERFIGTDGVQEICEVKAVIPFAGIGLHLFASEIKLLVASTVNLQGSAFAVEGAERPLLLAARMAAALVPTDANLAEVVRGIRRVGRFLIVIMMIARTVHRHTLGIIHLQAPAGHVHEVRSVVLHFAAAIEPVPVPVVMHEVILVRPLRTWALPEFPTLFAQPLGHLHKLALADAAATATVVAARKCRRPNLASLHPLDSLNDTRLAAALIAHLHLALVFLRRGHDQLGFARIVTGGFLHVHMFASFHRENGHWCVPKIRCGDGHRIDRFIVEDAPEIICALRILRLRKFR